MRACAGIKSLNAETQAHQQQPFGELQATCASAKSCWLQIVVQGMRHKARS